MLEKLLHEMRNNGFSSPLTLAEKLNTTPQMVIAMLDTLERLGYLRSTENKCNENSCKSCSASGLCKSGIGSRFKLRETTSK